MTFVWIIIATVIVSLISLVGIISLAVNRKILDNLLILFVGFAAGALMGTAFLHLLPEALETLDSSTVFLYVLTGFAFFFLMERYFHWRHCHNGSCEVHTFTYLNLFGDGIHNFIDGMLIATSFLISTKLGIIATLAIIFHEIPQEISDFAILLYGGVKPKKALYLNFLCALTAIIGAIVGYFLSSYVSSFSVFLIPFTAGGFIYIASSDLIPELHRQKDIKRANLALITFLLGIVLMYLAKAIHH